MNQLLVKAGKLPFYLLVALTAGGLFAVAAAQHPGLVNGTCPATPNPTPSS